MTQAVDPYPELRPCQRSREIEALLGTLAPATLAAVPLESYRMLTPYPWVIAVSLAVILVLASAFYQHRSFLFRMAASFTLMGWAAGSLYEYFGNPFRGLFILLSLVALLAYIWPAETLRQFNVRYPTLTQKKDILIASGIAIFVGLDHWLLLYGDQDLSQTLALSATYFAPLVFWARYRKRQNLAKSSIILALALLAFAPTVSSLVPPESISLDFSPLGVLSPFILFLIVARQSFVVRILPGRGVKETHLIDEILRHPSRVLVISFLTICCVGTMLLGLPIAARGDTPHSWLDATFTSVSATCVTGLIVLDTPVDFSAFGQFVILVLIQIGGLGIMVFSAAAIAILGRRLSLTTERAAVDLVGASNRASLNQSIRKILLVTFLTELVGAIVLSLLFWQAGDGWLQACWRGLFTSISAFCNAGFALQSDSLVSYADNPLVMITVALIIIFGGLGPLVVVTVLGFGGKKRTLHVRLVLWSSTLLVIAPGIFICLVEWQGVLGGLSLVDKLVNGFFQSVTLRTAGFNSVDLATIHPAVWTMMLMLMFIGGSPGSTAGGVKTTTIAVIFLAVFAIVKGQERIEVFGRSLPHITIIRALVVATLAIIGAGVALTTLQLTQVLSLEHAAFEVISALATVGLSQGGTAELDEIGKVIIIACMFAGRVGPLTLFVFLSSNNVKKPMRQLPEEPIPIG